MTDKISPFSKIINQAKQGPQKYNYNNRYIPKPYKDVAKGMEAQFAEYMISQMNKAVGKNTPESSASKYYKSLLDLERAKLMTEQGKGLGIQEMILNQIYPKRLRNKQNYAQYQKQNSVNTHNNKSNIKIKSDAGSNLESITIKDNKKVSLRGDSHE